MFLECINCMWPWILRCLHEFFVFLEIFRNRLVVLKTCQATYASKIQFLGFLVNNLVVWRCSPGYANLFLQFAAFLILLCCWCCLDESLMYTQVYFDVMGYVLVIFMMMVWIMYEFEVSVHIGIGGWIDVILVMTNEMVYEINIKLSNRDFCVMLNIKIMSQRVLESSNWGF